MTCSFTLIPKESTLPHQVTDQERIIHSHTPQQFGGDTESPLETHLECQEFATNNWPETVSEYVISTRITGGAVHY
jgi:hypothetical protein